jgi:hypothetical protein
MPESKHNFGGISGVSDPDSGEAMLHGGVGRLSAKAVERAKASVARLALSNLPRNVRNSEYAVLNNIIKLSSLLGEL